MGDALMADKRNIYPKPFLRWAGGKSWLIKYLDSIVGDYKFNCYHEPFLGGGSIFFYFASKMNTAYLSDFNNELIDTYSAIKNDPDGVIFTFREICKYCGRILSNSSLASRDSY